MATLNQRLLDRLDAENDWEDVDDRRLANDLLSDLADLRRRYGETIEVGLEPKPLRRQFDRLTEDLGYKARFRGGAFEFTPRDGEDQTRRRQMARALGWELSEIADASATAPQRLSIPIAEVPLPLSPSERARLLGQLEAGDPLLELIRDQRLSMVAAAKRRISEETWAALLAGEGGRLLYREASTFLRYSPALEIRGGELVLPGSNGARSAWSSLVKASAKDPVDFVADVIGKREGRAAFLLHSLAFLPPATADFYLGTGDGATADERRFAVRVLRRLDDTARSDFDRLRGGDDEFGTLARSLPVKSDGSGLALPGGPGLWYSAVKRGETPADRQSLSRAVARARGESLDEGEFLLRVLSETNEIRGVKKASLPRLTRTANLFGTREDLLSPANVILVARAVDEFPMALAVLDVLRFSRPEPVEAYLLAVAHLDSLPKSRDKELLLSGFLGGVELLRALAIAGRADHGSLEAALERWGHLHQSATSSDPLVGPWIDWLAELVGTLPESAEGAPGRGPLEQRLLGSLAGTGVLTAFSFQGLDYVGSRSTARASAMVLHLERQSVPSLDQLFQLRSTLEDLRRACQEGSAEAVSSLAARALAEVQALPLLEWEITRENRDVARRVLPLEREDLVDLLESVGSTRGNRRLVRRAEDLARASALLAHDARVVLLAPGYLHAVGDRENVLLETSALVPRHLLYADVGSDIPTDHPWLSAKIVSSETDQLGAHVLGHPAAIPYALSEATIPSGGRFIVRDRVWFQDFANTEWHRLDVDVNRALACLVEAGEGVLLAATEETGAAETVTAFVASRVPYYRIEASSRKKDISGFSLSERLMLGLAALEGDAYGPALAADFLEQNRFAWQERRQVLGEAWRERLNAAGASTPFLNGRSIRWLGTWQPYELFEQENLMRALIDRELVDARLRLLVYLGRRELPGEVGQDLADRYLADAAQMRIVNLRDWEGHLRWINDLDDAYFDDLVRGLLSRGLYSLSG